VRSGSILTTGTAFPRVPRGNDLWTDVFRPGMAIVFFSITRQVCMHTKSLLLRTDAEHAWFLYIGDSSSLWVGKGSQGMAKTFAETFDGALYLSLHLQSESQGRFYVGAGSIWPPDSLIAPTPDSKASWKKFQAIYDANISSLMPIFILLFNIVPHVHGSSQCLVSRELCDVTRDAYNKNVCFSSVL